MAFLPPSLMPRSKPALFALSWRANGLAYGIPRQIDGWLAAGQDVLVNGSRGYLPQARLRYPALIGVLAHGRRPPVLRERLLRRGRESIEQIEQRLARNAQFDAAAAERDGLHLLDNSGALEWARDNLLALHGASRACA